MVECPAADRLLQQVNFGNKGDECGEAGAAISLNRPYKGVFETVDYGTKLAAMNDQRVGTVQLEFLRETLLGQSAADDGDILKH